MLNFAHLGLGYPACEHLLEKMPSACGLVLLLVECFLYLLNVSTACGMLLFDCLFNSLRLIFYVSKFPGSAAQAVRPLQYWISFGTILENIGKPIASLPLDFTGVLAARGRGVAFGLPGGRGRSRLLEFFFRVSPLVVSVTQELVRRD